jgi:hypothetical protein
VRPPLLHKVRLQCLDHTTPRLVCTADIFNLPKTELNVLAVQFEATIPSRLPRVLVRLSISLPIWRQIFEGRPPHASAGSPALREQQQPGGLARLKG